jgi:HNH endonuclease/AP2 domain
VRSGLLTSQPIAEADLADHYFSAEQLRQVLDYDSLTGAFTWRLRPNRRIKVGDVAGSRDSGGYIAIRVLGRLNQAHRLAWLYTYGVWPDGHIDHIDGIRTNNSIANLRDVTHRINLQNQRQASSNNTHGFLGVSRNGNRWKAQIMVNGKNIHIGSHDSPELAHAAYIAAKRALHSGCTI